MKAPNLLLRCMAWQEAGQWVAVCLDFNLAAQDDSFEEVKARLNQQIRSYLIDALAGDDKPHAPYLLRRRAPLRYWLAYGLIVLQHKLRLHVTGAREYSNSVPLAPA